MNLGTLIWGVGILSSILTIMPKSCSNITVIEKPDKDTRRKEGYRPIFLMNIDAKTLNKILANQIQQYIKKIIYHNQLGFSPGVQGWFCLHKSVNVIHYINRMEDKNHVIISIHAGDKIEHCFKPKKKKKNPTLNKLDMEGL